MISFIHHSACLSQAWSMEDPTGTAHFDSSSAVHYLKAVVESRGSPLSWKSESTQFCVIGDDICAVKTPATASALQETTQKLPTFSSFSLSICDFPSPSRGIFFSFLFFQHLPIHLSILLFAPLYRVHDYLRLPTSVQFSSSVVSDTLWPHGLQHARLTCPSPTPRAYSNSRPSRQWCHPTISSSVVPVSSHLPSFPASGS